MAVVYSPKEYATWQKDALEALKQAHCEAPFEGPVEVLIECFVPRPKTTKLPHPKPDVDNYAKSVLDAITKDGRFWSDDSQVRTLNITKAWGLRAAIHVTIRGL